jgi:NAD(P)-dependent dehydrogenase (short-subunit alcohol dehydrogenase family)
LISWGHNGAWAGNRPYTQDLARPTGKPRYTWLHTNEGWLTMTQQRAVGTRPPVALVVGAGDATGGAIARRFAREGYAVCVTRREKERLKTLVADIEAAGGVAHAFGSDARKEADTIALFEEIERDIGETQVAVFNIGANVRFSIEETTARVYTKVWEMAAFAGFLMGREAARRMAPRGRGTIIFTGATASVRGSAGFAAFAGAKHALRALAQSMARELGPKGVHVAHVLIDGAIDTAFIRDNFPEAYARKSEDGILSPGHIADMYWMLHRQPRDAWTHELDLRPWIEKW